MANALVPPTLKAVLCKPQSRHCSNRAISAKLLDLSPLLAPGEKVTLPEGKVQHICCDLERSTAL